MEGVRENILLLKDLLAHRKLCHQLYFLKYLVLFTVHNRIITFFFKIFSTQTDLVLISRHRHALLSVLIRERRLTRVFRNKTLLHTANKYPCCHIPPAYICQHLCATMALALFLPSP